MIVKRPLSKYEYGLFSERPSMAREVLFTAESWHPEQPGWEHRTVGEIGSLPPEPRRVFLRYAYDVGFGTTVGTFDWRRARHLSNFMNHSCRPNVGFDARGDVVAARDIGAGEELRIDYGSFMVNVDQAFLCRCGSDGCRRRVRRDDWRTLRFGSPKFMHSAVSDLSGAGREAEGA
jgi:hypothetical protein